MGANPNATPARAVLVVVITMSIVRDSKSEPVSAANALSANVSPLARAITQRYQTQSHADKLLDMKSGPGDPERLRYNS